MIMRRGVVVFIEWKAQRESAAGDSRKSGESGDK
jgi:hypothetical protein